MTNMEIDLALKGGLVHTNLADHCRAVVRCDLAHEILRTPIASLGPAHLPCAPIVLSQLLSADRASADAEWNAGRWQVPEPWNGHLASAPILFIGQNPSADFSEDYPRASFLQQPDADETVLQTFVHRFDSMITDGSRPKRLDNGVARSNPFLRTLNILAARLLNCDTESVRPGFDYALTEAVRCKSANAIGLDQALPLCASRFLPSTLSLSGARIIVCMGSAAQRAFCIATNLPLPSGRLSEQRGITHTWNDKYVLFLTHSNYRGTRKLEDVLPDSVVAEVSFRSRPSSDEKT
jgi:uracil-DNA glycosylase